MCILPQQIEGNCINPVRKTWRLMNSALRYSNVLAGLGALVLASQVTLLAQNTAQMAGIVLDPSRRPVPGAAINVTKKDTGTTYRTTTDLDGSFLVPQIDAGLYYVDISAVGFRTYRRTGIKLDVGRVTALPVVQLTLGEVRETVTVEAAENPVQTTTVDVSNTRYTEQIKYLPLAQRNVLDLISLQAGVGTNGIANTVINGTRTSATNVTIDGINVQDNYNRSNGLDYLPNLPILGQVAEMTVTTANPDVALGNGSSQVALVTPSGNNDFHGEVFWENRTSATSANDFFGRLSGLPKPFVLLNQAGGALGGPIRRNKLFFYMYYEAYRLKSKNQVLSTVLYPEARNGNFSYLDSSNTLRTLNVLQTANIPLNSLVRTTLQSVPSTVNFPFWGDGLNTGGYLFNQRDDHTRDNIGTRLDYFRSPHTSFSGTFSWNRDVLDRPEFDQSFNTIPAVFNNNNSKLLSLTWRWTPSTHSTNQLRGGFNLAPGVFETTQDFSKPMLAGFVFTNPANLFQRQGRDASTYNFMDNVTWLREAHTVRFGWQSQMIRIRSYDEAGTDPVYYIGLSLSNPQGLQANQFPGGISGSQLDYANQLLASLGGIISDASQIFNVVSRTSGYVPRVPAVRDISLNSLSFYAADQWHIKHNLTLNYGLRWDYMGRYNEKNGLSLAPVIQNSNPVQTLLSNATVDFAGGATGRPLYKRDLNNFGPNIGLAWDPFGGGKTAVRMAYSINYINDESILAPNNVVTSNPGLTTVATLTGLTEIANGALGPLPTPTFAMPRTFSDQLKDNPLAPGFAIDPQLVTPYIQQWNVSLQREILKRTTLEVRYVGNKGTKLYRGVDFNQIDIKSNGFLDDFLRARGNGFRSLALTGTFDPSYNAAVPGSQQLTVFPSLGSGGLLDNPAVRSLIQSGETGELASAYVTSGLAGSVHLVPNPNIFVADLLGNFSNSSYNALQIELTRRITSRLFWDANYTWGKILTDSPGTNAVRFDAYLDIANPKLERARADYDIPQALKMNFVYVLPFGSGRLRSGRRIVQGISSGWIVSSIFVCQSGPPFSVVSRRGTLNRTSRSGYNTATTALDGAELNDLLGVRRIGSAYYFIDPRVIGADGRAVAADGSKPFQGQVFFNPDPGTVGSIQRRMFNGPVFVDWDFSVLKQMTFLRNKKAEVRVDFFNLPNTVVFFVGDQNINSPTFGRITGTANSPRSLQAGLRIAF